MTERSEVEVQDQEVREQRAVDRAADESFPASDPPSFAAAGASDRNVDRDRLVSLLNEDLETEYQSIVQYVLHASTLKGAEFASLVEELKTHLGQELEHAMTLAEQIDFLGGTPSVHVPKVEVVKDSKRALESDLELEERQLERYRVRVQQATDLGLGDVAEVIRPILEQTQDHVRDLRSALGR